MEPFIKEPTIDTPRVVLDAESGVFEISQMSLPEDAVDFYAPIINWLMEYSENPQKETVFNMKLEYFNTASSK
ncbi:MAG: SiaC family regulatory phosphoprotein, partial [Bacteroidales bacterium]|nr:SiaC family regulatory phosphoprotein [Bacteroidales bacterium]